MQEDRTRDPFTGTRRLSWTDYIATRDALNALIAQCERERRPDRADVARGALARLVIRQTIGGIS
jgi:hypothetical protein